MGYANLFAEATIELQCRVLGSSELMIYSNARMTAVQVTVLHVQ